jgi:hypothetical protein
MATKRSAARAKATRARAMGVSLDRVAGGDLARRGGRWYRCACCGSVTEEVARPGLYCCRRRAIFGRGCPWPDNCLPHLAFEPERLRAIGAARL